MKVHLFSARDPFKPRDWTTQELAEFYRVETVLRSAGIPVDIDRGLSDEGDPWFVFCRPQSGDVIIHFARCDGFYVVASSGFQKTLRGRNFRELMDAFIACQPLVLGHQNKPGTVVLHPSALLSILVATSLFLIDNQETAAASLGVQPSGETTNSPFSSLIQTLLEPLRSQEQRDALITFGALVAGLAAIILDDTGTPIAGALDLFEPKIDETSVQTVGAAENINNNVSHTNKRNGIHDTDPNQKVLNTAQEQMEQPRLIIESSAETTASGTMPIFVSTNADSGSRNTFENSDKITAVTFNEDGLVFSANQSVGARAIEFDQRHSSQSLPSNGDATLVTPADEADSRYTDGTDLAQADTKPTPVALVAPVTDTVAAKNSLMFSSDTMEPSGPLSRARVLLSELDPNVSSHWITIRLTNTEIALKNSDSRDIILTENNSDNVIAGNNTRGISSILTPWSNESAGETAPAKMDTRTILTSSHDHLTAIPNAGQFAKTQSAPIVDMREDVAKAAVTFFAKSNPDFMVTQMGRDVILRDPDPASSIDATEIHVWQFTDGSKITIIGALPDEYDA